MPERNCKQSFVNIKILKLLKYRVDLMKKKDLIKK